MTPQDKTQLEELRIRVQQKIGHPTYRVLLRLIELERAEATEQACICPGCGHTDPMCHHTPDTQNCPCGKDAKTWEELSRDPVCDSCRHKKSKHLLGAHDCQECDEGENEFCEKFQEKKS